MSGPLGDKVPPPKPAEQPEWKPYGTDGRFQINKHGQLRTNPATPLPPAKPTPFPFPLNPGVTLEDDSAFIPC